MLFLAADSFIAIALPGTVACCLLAIRWGALRACSCFAQGNCNVSNATPQVGASDDAASQESAREMSQQDAAGAGADVVEPGAHAPGGPKGGPMPMPADGADEATSSLSSPMVSHMYT